MLSVPALRWIARTTETICSTDWPGKMSSRYETRALEASTCPISPSPASAKKTSGTNESSAKYATIAARWVPRSRKKWENADPIGNRAEGSMERANCEVLGSMSLTSVWAKERAWSQSQYGPRPGGRGHALRVPGRLAPLAYP